MEQQMRQNPLKSFYRQFKLYMKLPSGTSYYPEGTIEFTDMDEVGIMPMTGKDELILKNPDALLNGEALVEVIRSCVPAVKNPKALLSNDIDAIITAIRYATFNDKLETEMTCPSCKHENLFKLDLQYALDNMTYLEKEYVINLESGISVFVKPYGFPELLRGLHAQFEQSKITRAIESENISDEQKMKMFTTAFTQMSLVTHELMLNSVVKVVNEQAGINVTDRQFIKEFLYNIEKKQVDQISDLIKEINQIGILKTFTAKCDKCGHEWESEIDFNPVNFS